MRRQYQAQSSTSNASRGRAFVIGTGEARHDPNVVTCTFLVSGQCASVLFDTGADRSFVSINFLPLKNMPVSELKKPYTIELANVGMDWLSMYKAEIVCKDKPVRIPLSNDEEMIDQGEKYGTILPLVSQLKALKYLRQGCTLYSVSVTYKDSDEKRLEDILVVHEYSDVFPDELPGLPPTRPVEFRIDLIPGVALIAKEPYQLAPFEIQELSNQLQ
ncbi:uncharacterized protein LOC143603158 [Bidens hawaiensis]|uniref:uncharacterized protein LOC143603158 n=1 Tax=Bidens hawaiensis TaxID=980011 RepID=UPI00404A3676